MYCKTEAYSPKAISCIFPVTIMNKPIKVEEFIRVLVTSVAEYCKVSESLIYGRSAVREVVEARHICMYLIRKYRPEVYLKHIGEVFSNRDHSTVIYGLNTVDNLLHERFGNSKFKLKFKIIEDAYLNAQK